MEASGRLIGVEIGCLAEICKVHEILPLFSPSQDILGVVDLRGTMIPLLDPMMLCQGVATAEAPALAAILRQGRNLVALGCDRAIKIADFDSAKIQALYENGLEYRGTPILSGILEDGASINLIDTALVFSKPDLPKGQTEESRGRNENASGAARAYLTFEAGGATFALDAIRIFGTVPRRPIERTSLSHGSCLGEISYLGRRIPTMDATKVLGLGDTLRQDQSEIVVVNFGDGRQLGFAVDEIQQIRMIHKREHVDLPNVLAAVEAPFSSVLSLDGEQQVFVIDPEQLLAREELDTMASLSDRSETDKTTKERIASASKGSKGAVRSAGHRCLVFTAGVKLCAPVTEVVGVLASVGKLTPFGGDASAFLGFFSHGNTSVPLLSLAKELGMALPDQDSDTRILLVGSAEHRIGYLVDSVDGVEIAETLTDAEHDNYLSDEIAVLKTSKGKEVLPHLVLGAMAAECAIPSAQPG
ncbi:MAG: chemotaxis protein CheW [Pseudomonadota bacterium]